MKSKLLFLVGGLLLVSGCGWSERLLPPVEVTVSSSTVGQLNETEQKTWKTYRDEKSGFEVRYPADFVLIPAEEGNFPGMNTKATFAFPSKSHQGTDLQEALVGVAVEAKCPELSSATTYSGSLPATIDVGGGMRFSRLFSADAAMGNYYNTTAYTTTKNNTCYAVALNLHSTNRMNYDESDRPKPYDPKPFEDVLVKIVTTFKILK